MGGEKHSFATSLPQGEKRSFVTSPKATSSKRIGRRATEAPTPERALRHGTGAHKPRIRCHPRTTPHKQGQHGHQGLPIAPLQPTTPSSHKWQVASHPDPENQINRQRGLLCTVRTEMHSTIDKSPIWGTNSTPHIDPPCWGHNSILWTVPPHPHAPGTIDKSPCLCQFIHASIPTLYSLHAYTPHAAHSSILHAPYRTRKGKGRAEQ
eukprot:scaffold85928_cov37-Tisochrysis_lutea.AAC.3